MTQIQRDPRTWQANPEREGKPGHHGFGRDRVLFIRVVPSVWDAIEQRAIAERRPINDVVNDDLAHLYLGPRPDAVPIAEPAEPELTPEQAFESCAPALKEFFGEEEERTAPTPAKPAPEKETTQAPTLWGDEIEPKLRAVMGDAFDGSYLSCLRYVSHDETTVTLCAKAQVYIDDLANLRPLLAEVCAPRNVELIVKAEEESPAPIEEESPAPSIHPLLALLIAGKVDTVDELEALHTREMTKVHQRRLEDAHTRSRGCLAREAAEVAILNDQRQKEMAALTLAMKKLRALVAFSRASGNLRQPGNPQYHRQYSRPSAFDTDGPLTRGDLPKKKDLS